MRKTYLTAIAIAFMLTGWLASGAVSDEPPVRHASIAELNRENSRIQEEAAPTRVRVQVIDASNQSRIVKVRGKTTNKRTVEVKVELAGSIVNRPVERGTPVVKNDLLCEISIEDRDVALNEARESLNQARIEYEGALSLREKGYNSETAIAGAKARLASAQATLSRRELALSKTQVRAPFNGIVEDVHQEIGDYVTPGASCATVIDMDPMLLVGRVSESDVIDLELGQLATGYLRNGAIVTGPVSFIGQQSDPTTRTYPIEIELANAEGNLRSGITTEIHVPVDSVLAQKVSPALFSLADDGGIGVRTVNTNNIVEFHRVEILSDDTDGVWVSGLPNRAAIIVVGQELVTAGERVDPIFQDGVTLDDRQTAAAQDAPEEAAMTVEVPTHSNAAH